MPIIGTVTEWLEWARAYLFGRGMVSFAVAAAWIVAEISGVGLLLPALVVGIGGAIFHGFMIRQEQRENEQRMIGLYRDEIAAVRGIDPKKVTRDDLYEVAKENSVIGSELNRQHRENSIYFVTGILAGAVTFGALFFAFAHHDVASMLVKSLGEFYGTALSIFSVAIVSSISNLLVYDGLGTAISAGSGLRENTAHQRILQMQQRLQFGFPVKSHHVLSVMAACDPELDKRIEAQFGKSYNAMGRNERKLVAAEIGEQIGAAAVARSINDGDLKPGSLAFLGEPTAPPTKREEIREQESPARGRFTERFTARSNAELSHVERLAMERAGLAAERTV